LLLRGRHHDDAVAVAAVLNSSLTFDQTDVDAYDNLSGNPRLDASHVHVASSNHVKPLLVAERSAMIGPDWSETFLNHEQAGTCTFAESVANGHSIIQISMLASYNEVQLLKIEALAAADKRMNGGPEHSRQTEQRIVALRAAYLKADQPWRTSSALTNRNHCRDRLPLYALPAPGAELCDALLLRALSIMDRQINSQLTRDLFGDCLVDASSCRYNPRLKFATGEPAINVYSSGGAFKPHEDKEALTILVPLSGASEFDGGGTAFWSRSDAGPGGSVSVNEGTMQEPTLVLKPAAGTAIIFGGDVTHAGQACTGGRRCIFVASFSPRTNEHLVAALDRQAAGLLAGHERPPPGSHAEEPATVSATSGSTSSSGHKRMAEILGGRR
jgi:hypothetical protein